MKTTMFRILALTCALGACDADDVTPADADAPRTAEIPTATPAAAPALALAPDASDERTAAPGPAMPHAKAAFAKVTELVSAQYVGGPLGDDEIWTGAIEGVLARLARQGDPRVNMLMSPAELEELVIGTKGLLVGVGIKIERVADIVVVAEVIAGGPAERAGLAAGDRVLGIDGERIAGLAIADVVGRIRGTDGSHVSLFVQRDTEEWTVDVTRGQIRVDSVESAPLGDGLGYVRITSFAEDTPEELGVALASLRAQGARRIVLDLRDCPGGVLDATVGIAEHFLAPGRTVLTIEHRGGENEVLQTAEDRGGTDFGLAVLIGPHTASSAEILADALHEHGRAMLVGETTFGKRTIESVHELGEGWAVKLSVSRFVLASGAEGGVKPDIRIPADPDRKPARIGALQPDDDASLAAAMELLDRG